MLHPVRPLLLPLSVGLCLGVAPLHAVVLKPQATPAPEPGDAKQELLGLWSKHASMHAQDPLRFYYFHEGGLGIYRYGKVGHNQTHAFNYTVDGDAIRLEFRKSAEHHVVRFRIERDPHHQGRSWLILSTDPREGGGEMRYFRDPHQSAGCLQPDMLSRADGPLPGGRTWVDLRRFATGGQAFSMYQFKDAAIDGRGIGWHHQGDFDEWTTENLFFRVRPGSLELSFPMRQEVAVTTFSLQQERDARYLQLQEDPRGFWHQRRFKDEGPTFVSLQAPITTVVCTPVLPPQ